MMDQKTHSRFWAKVDKRGRDDCWPWMAARLRRGYGAFKVRIKVGLRKQIRAHRVAFCLSRNYPMNYLTHECVIRHTCDNPCCVNPAHLEIGSYQDNSDDMMRRGRNRQRRGGDHGMAKLSEMDVSDIHKQLKSGKSQGEIAAAFGVSKSNISGINTGRHWAHMRNR